jgi:hypothetical protein
MCNHCQKRESSLEDSLQQFLKPGVTATFTKGDGIQKVSLVDAGGSHMDLIADGDDGGYFHWRK